MCARLCYLSRDPLLFLVVPPMISSSCQCMYFLDRPWQPPFRTRATSKGWCKKRKELSSYFQTWHIATAHLQRRPQNMHQDLGWVLVGRSEGAVGVSRVQTGPVHVAVPDACLFQHFLKIAHTDVWPFHVLQKLLGVKAGPLESRFTSENVKGNAIRINRTFVLRLRTGQLILRYKQLSNYVLMKTEL